MPARPRSAPPAPETLTATAMPTTPISAPPAPEIPTARAMQPGSAPPAPKTLAATAMPATPRNNGGRPVMKREKDNDLCVHVHKAQYATY